jgi:predicted nucleic acid-binding protein
MAIKVALDTNIILDLADQKRTTSSKTIQFLENLVEEQPNVVFCISSLSYINVLYIVKSHMKSQELHDELEFQMLESYEIMPIGKSELMASRHAKMQDFEDAVQIFAAYKYGCDYIVSNDKKGFVEGPLKWVNPQEA